MKTSAAEISYQTVSVNSPKTLAISVFCNGVINGIRFYKIELPV